MNSALFDDAVVVGGSGMLAGFSRALLSVARKVTVMARDKDRIRAIAPAIVPFVCDYNNPETTNSLVNLSPDLVVAWVHGRMPDFRRALARRVRPGGRFVQVLGSAHGDPSRPGRFEEMKALTDGLPLVYQAVILGFAVDGSRTRWLRDTEISDGVFAAVESSAPLSIVGTVTPWSSRP